MIFILLITKKQVQITHPTVMPMQKKTDLFKILLSLAYIAVCEVASFRFYWELKIKTSMTGLLTFNIGVLLPNCEIYK